MIPPHGWEILIVSYVVILGLMTTVYWLTRRWSSRADYSMFGLFFFFLLAVVFAVAMPRAAIVPVWAVMVGSAGWLIAALLRKEQREWPLDLAAMLTAISFVMFFLPLYPGVFMGDGTKSVAIMAGLLPVALSVILPAVDGLLVRHRTISR